MGMLSQIRLWRWLPAIGCMVVIFILSHRSGEQLDSWLPHFQHWLPWLESFDPMHYAAYFVLALAIAYGFGAVAFSWRGCLWIIAISFFYGMTDEWHQSFVPNRSADLLDLWHDVIGASAACLLLQCYRLGKTGIHNGKEEIADQAEQE
jgi:hypothetical protein